MSDWFKMKTKFVGKCKVCSKIFEVDDEVLWKKGEGVKCPTECKAESVFENVPPNEMSIEPKEWKDFNKYNLKTLSKIANCQCCGTKLDITMDSFINDDKRTCARCFLK